MSSLYETLGVDPDATPEQVSKAYRKRARETHPDHGGDAEEFKALVVAYEVLSDEERRERYDRTGSTTETLGVVEQTIASLAMRAFAGEHADPIRWMCDQVDNERSQRRQSIRSNTKKLESMRKKLDKFVKHNADTENTKAREFISSTIEAAISGLESQIAVEEEMVKIGTEILAYLNGIRYPSEKPTDRRSVDLGGYNFSSMKWAFE